jgi:acetyl-CoA acetyltransferase
MAHSIARAALDVMLDRKRMHAGANPNADLFGLSAVLETDLDSMIPQRIAVQPAPRLGSSKVHAAIAGLRHLFCPQSERLP